MTVTTISIPSHSTRSKPSPHVVYQVNVQDDEQGEYTIWRRFSEFAALDKELKKIAPPPQPFPSDSGFHLSFQQPFSSWLDDDFLEGRRKGLEAYLNGVMGAKLSSLWTKAQDRGEAKVKSAFQKFIGKDEEPAPQVEQPVANTAKGIDFKGLNSYYLHTFNDPDRGQVLDAMQGAGFKILRIFIGHVNANNKGSNNRAVNDVEPTQLGNYDDTVLGLVDQLMLECSQRGMKLIIALHDRYALGFWDVDRYAVKYGIVPPGTTGSPQHADASIFYTSDDAKTYFDKRIDHILQHRNSKMGNKKWGELGSVVYAFEAENEPMGHMQYIQTWIQDRSGRIKENLVSGSGILVANGGGVDIGTSTTSEHLSMPNVDIVCVHDYSSNPWNFLPTISTAAGKARANGKTLIIEEWGAKGNSKADILYAFVEACWDYGISWLVWEFVKPGKGANDFEIWTNETADWNALKHQATGN